MLNQLFEGTQIGSIHSSNRIVMAPMTRSRADSNGVPGELASLYYVQRASAGLIISEAINISIDAIGSPHTPGLFNDAQVEAWKRVTSAVHEAGGVIFAQLWHTGRVGHSQVREGRLPVAPSAIPIVGQQHFTSAGMLDYEVPHALKLEEVRATILDYRFAAERAQQAGFDGVELHGAFGYLPNQFLVDGANQRNDMYGGSIENRCRFVLEVMKELIDVWGNDRVGIKLSPLIPFNGMIDSDPRALYLYLLQEMNKLFPAYVHMMNALFPLDDFPHWPTDALGTFRPHIKSTVIGNGGYNAEKAEAELISGRADLISFGSLFIANPDLPARFKSGAPLMEADRATMYGGGAHGYIDYQPMAI